MKKQKSRVESINQPVIVGNASHVVSVMRPIDKSNIKKVSFAKGIRWSCLAKTGCLRIALT